MRFKFLFPEKGIDSSALSRGRLRITEQQLGQTALNDTAIKKMARLEGLEPPSSPSKERRVEADCFVQLSYRRAGKGL